MKRLVSLLLMAVMLVTLIPAAVFADSEYSMELVFENGSGNSTKIQAGGTVDIIPVKTHWVDGQGENTILPEGPEAFQFDTRTADGPQNTTDLTFTLIDAATGTYRLKCARDVEQGTSYEMIYRGKETEIVGRRIYVTVDGIAPLPFTDVAKDAYYYKAVEWAYDNNVTSGTSATTFGSTAECNRAQIVTFLWNAAGQPEPATTENAFTDVKTTDWFYKAVLWAVENKVTSGTSATTFNPTGKCTYEQIVTFIWNAQGQPAAEISEAYAGKWYGASISWAEGLGLLENTKGFAIGTNCPRCDIVEYLYQNSKM